jgi:hypothetical protein
MNRTDSIEAQIAAEKVRAKQRDLQARMVSLQRDAGGTDKAMNEATMNQSPANPVSGEIGPSEASSDPASPVPRRSAYVRTRYVPGSMGPDGATLGGPAEELVPIGIRVPRTLREDFGACTMLRGTKMTTVLREFMAGYVRESQDALRDRIGKGGEA